jgi:type II secretory pathway pseudopilin PulG
VLLMWGLAACAGIPGDGGSGFASSSQHQQQQQQQVASQQQQQLQQLRLLHGGLEAMDEDEDTLQQPGSAGTGF